MLCLWTVAPLVNLPFGVRLSSVSSETSLSQWGLESPPPQGSALSCTTRAPRPARLCGPSVHSCWESRGLGPCPRASRCRRPHTGAPGVAPPLPGGVRGGGRWRHPPAHLPA